MKKIVLLSIYFVLTSCISGSPTSIAAVITEATRTVTPTETPTVLAAQATETAIFATVHSASTAQVATSLAQPRTTPDLTRLANLTRTPQASATPGITFKYKSGVPIDQRTLIERGVAIARKNFGEVYNISISVYATAYCDSNNPDRLDSSCPGMGIRFLTQLAGLSY